MINYYMCLYMSLQIRRQLWPKSGFTILPGQVRHLWDPIYTHPDPEVILPII